jgi:hypothetical protein
MSSEAISIRASDNKLELSAFVLPLGLIAIDTSWFQFHYNILQRRELGPLFHRTVCKMDKWTYTAELHTNILIQNVDSCNLMSESSYTLSCLTLWFSILLRVYYKSSLTSTVRNFSLIYLFILFLSSTARHVSAHPQAILRYDSYKHNSFIIDFRNCKNHSCSRCKYCNSCSKSKLTVNRTITAKLSTPMELEFFLRPTVSRPVSLGIGTPFGTLDEILACSSFFV